MKIIIFPDSPSSDLDGKLIRLFENQHFVPLVDDKHGNDQDWFRKNFDGPFRLYSFDQQNLITLDIDDMKQPVKFVIYFNQNEIITEFEWYQIELYLTHIIYEHPITERTKRCIERIRDQQLTLKPFVSPQQPDLPQFYEFKSHFIEEDDIALFEITKANSTTPYTTVVRQFSVKGYKPLFTNYFACNAFRNDFVAITFLQKLWKEYMQGPMDLDQLLKDATEACYPNENYIPIAEPEVYIKSIPEVIQQIKR